MLFDRVTRERVWLLYAWCRRCDDIADGQDHGGALSDEGGSPHDRIEAIRVLTRRALDGQPTADLAFDAFGQVAMEAGLTEQMAKDVIEGFQLDSEGWRPRTEADLIRYCYHVAGAVGVMMAKVMGVPDDDTDTLDRACDLGIAFQLANIARDISEDEEAGRCYIPTEWLAEADIPPGELMKPHYRERLVRLVRRMCARERTYEASARIGASRLRFRQRWAILAATEIYGAIARAVELAGHHAWDHRQHTSGFNKFTLVLRAGWLALINMPEAADTPRYRRIELQHAARETR